MGLEGDCMVGENEISKPQDVTEFLSWAKKHIGVEFSKSTELLYKMNSANIKSTAEENDFFKKIHSIIRAEEEKFFLEYKSQLMMNDEETRFYVKPYASLLNKIFRLNVNWNKNFPHPPQKGWITPQNMYEIVDDMVRGKLVCKYADGPHILANILCENSNKCGVEGQYSDRSLDSGYYSVHCYFYIPVEIVLDVTSPEHVKRNVRIELQITSQLQDILYNITHQFYVKNRTKTSRSGSSWKWKFETNEFKAGFLGHALHLFEGIIVELRNDSISEDTVSESEE
ncbi:MAG: hypothetical protein ACD_19C00234G0002 [uncultured bacterium]|nr:MAG: hypothetical protein ACD_19C00234G0002 [uncultured bacterium]